MNRWFMRVEVSDLEIVRDGWIKAERNPEGINPRIKVLC